MRPRGIWVLQNRNDPQKLGFASGHLNAFAALEVPNYRPRGAVHETVSRSIFSKYRDHAWFRANCVRGRYAHEGTTCSAGCRSELDRFFRWSQYGRLDWGRVSVAE